ncbi:MAG: hypothetical protein ACYDHW_06955 [Syntrophorhabdaceae bacterium]
MSIPAWPGTLPQRLLISGYGESLPNTLLRTSMDMGPAKQRRRGAAGATPINGKLILTSTERTAFLTFFNTTLLGGSLRFSWVDPVDGVTANEMRFTETPSISAISGNLFEVNMSLEIMP